MEEETFICF